MSNTSNEPVPGWVGGFAQSNPAFAYPDPDLKSLPMLDNMDNIDKLERMQTVQWPEFSWLTVLGDESSRCYQMFAPQISRIGYTNEGRVYSIICPQQGTYSPLFGNLNVEVTVTGQRGWVDESAKTMAADMTVVGKVWFTPDAKENKLVKTLMWLFEQTGWPFPFDKDHAIVVQTSRDDHADEPIFPVAKGEITRFKSPDFARHEDEAWDVANVEVQIGEIVSTGNALVDEFNQLVIDAFNIGAGNLLANGSQLSWNVWFTAPQYVDQEEWRDHANFWRHSIDVDHKSPDGPGTDPRYFDGTKFKPIDAIVDEELDKIGEFIKKLLRHL